MSLINSYMDVLNESSGNKGMVPGAVPGTGKPVTGNPPKVKPFEKPDGMESKTPTEGHSSDDEGTKPKPAPKSSLLKNSYSSPFDVLVNKVLSEGEESWENDDMESESPDFSFSADMSEGEGEGEEEEGEEEEGGEDMEEGGEDMEAVLNHLKSAVEALEALLGNQGEDEDNGDDMPDMPDLPDMPEDTMDEPEALPEAVDAEIVGHALVQINKLLGGLTNTNNKISGAVPTSSGKATVPKGSEGDGELNELKDNPEKLTKSDNKVGTVNKVGKSIFEQ